MPGSRITSKQIEIYMENRRIGKTQVVSAAKSNISERSGREIEHGRHRSQKENVRAWQTRKDPFAEVWNSTIVPLLKQGSFQSTFLLEQLQKQWPGKFPNHLLRSLQRKVKKWKALAGPSKEVMFLQEHQPGKLGISDFTHPKNIKVTINSEPLEHIFYHFRLPYSGINYAQVFKGSGESFTAFAQGLQEALHYIGGVPESHRTDSLSASFKNLSKDAQEDLTDRYKAFADHYGMKAIRINPGKGHENGSIESSHRHWKNRVEQSLIIRGSTDFHSFDEYRSFIHEVTKQHNKQNAKNVEIEQAVLSPLPVAPAVDYTEVIAVASSTSTITIKRVTYSVPNRLIGERLHVRLYNDKLECYLGCAHVLTLNRGHIPSHGKRARVVDYRHVIESLAKKPNAFYGYRLRDALFPNDNYRFIWDYVDRTMSRISACKFMVGLLQLAATQDCEEELGRVVMDLIFDKKLLDLNALQNEFNKNKPSIPTSVAAQHTLHTYNEFIPNYQGAY